MFPADVLVRVRVESGELVTGAGPGRGAWVGPSVACLQLASDRQGLRRGLGAEANVAAIARLLKSWSTGLLACPHESD